MKIQHLGHSAQEFILLKKWELLREKHLKWSVPIQKCSILSLTETHTAQPLYIMAPLENTWCLSLRHHTPFEKLMYKMSTQVTGPSPCLLLCLFIVLSFYSSINHDHHLLLLGRSWQFWQPCLWWLILSCLWSHPFVLPMRPSSALNCDIFVGYWPTELSIVCTIPRWQWRQCLFYRTFIKPCA